MTTTLPTASLKFLRDILAMTACIVLVAVTANAEQIPELSESLAAEKIATSTGRSLGGKTATAKRQVFNQPVASKGREQVQQATLPDFEIYDATVELYYDDDFDGHFYGVAVTFDADTAYAVADVFARLYLSFEGGPWEHYYTTDVFTIFGTSASDLYEVETELFSGYPTGYYDVRIELFDADYDDFLAGLGPQDSSALRDLPLEDQYKDGFSAAPPVISFSQGSGGGSTSLMSLALLGSVLLRRKLTTRSAHDHR